MEYEVNPKADVEGDAVLLPVVDADGNDIKYLFYCAKAKQGTTKTSGREKFGLKLEIGNAGEFQGQSIWNDVTMIPKGQPGHGFTVAALKAFGILGDGVDKVTINAESFEEKWAMATVKTDAWMEGDKVRKKTKVDAWITDRSQIPNGGAPVGRVAAAQPEIEEVPF